jgi:hypothetical protein
MRLIIDTHIFDLWNFIVETVNGWHILASLGVRGCWWLFVWGLALLLGVRGWSRFSKKSGSVHSSIWITCLNTDLDFFGCSWMFMAVRVGFQVSFGCSWVIVGDRVFYKYPNFSSIVCNHQKPSRTHLFVYLEYFSFFTSYQHSSFYLSCCYALTFYFLLLFLFFWYLFLYLGVRKWYNLIFSVKHRPSKALQKW